ncbi:MAG: hypothetical protein JO370_11135 [Paucibacter sp.]|nr:hypothetical protein [Roseateles sp.]
MHCFNHPDIEAVGICKVCQKGICPVCAADLEHSIACKGKHESQAEAINSLVLRSMNFQGAAGKARYAGPAFYAFMGAVFLFFGLRDSRGLDLPVYIGAGFLVFAVISFTANRRAFRSTEPDSAG